MADIRLLNGGGSDMQRWLFWEAPRGMFLDMSYRKLQ